MTETTQETALKFWHERIGQYIAPGKCWADSIDASHNTISIDSKTEKVAASRLGMIGVCYCLIDQVSSTLVTSKMFADIPKVAHEKVSILLHEGAVDAKIFQWATHKDRRFPALIYKFGRRNSASTVEMSPSRNHVVIGQCREEDVLRFNLNEADHYFNALRDLPVKITKQKLKEIIWARNNAKAVNSGSCKLNLKSVQKALIKAEAVIPYTIPLPLIHQDGLISAISALLESHYQENGEQDVL